MPRGKVLSDVEVGKVLAFFDEGFSKRAIAKKLEKSETAVRNVLKNPENYGKNRPGGPKSKLTDRNKRSIIQNASNSMKTAKQIAADCGLTVSKWTIHRVLKQSKHIVRQKLQPAPRLLERHKVARVAFARKNMQTDFSKVMNLVLLVKYRLSYFYLYFN